jgi:hypothetical protein
MRPPLEAAAARASRAPFFLGRALAFHQRRHGLDDAALAAELGLAPPLATPLAGSPGAPGPLPPTLVQIGPWEVAPKTTRHPIILPLES